ncbi:MAG: hypothetical protein KatS3mg026_0617 [Bacteroidia bacterium]|nr:MAG: hypothetical protein KatS3mg026_0617 [Bacteroidia bacterium]
MHHLGHVFLAVGPPPFQFGAFIADGVRGAAFHALPPAVQAGVAFHRWVDWQTDRHAAFRAARALLRPYAGRYAGLIVDLWLDVTLGRHWGTFLPEEPLPTFAERFVRETIRPWRAYAPSSWGPLLQALEEENLLERFGSPEGMKAHLLRFIARRGLPLQPHQVLEGLQRHAEELEELLTAFWNEAHQWRRWGPTE